MSPPPCGYITQTALLAQYPALTLRSLTRRMTAGAWPRPVKMSDGGRAWLAAEVQQAMQAPAASSAGTPPGHVSFAALVGVPAVSRAQCRRNEADGAGPVRPLQARPGLVPLTAAGVRAAITAGSFPRPVLGPWGEAWPLGAVRQWLARRGAT